MSKPLHPMALFRLMVLGPLASRSGFKRGEVAILVRELAARTYDIPDSRRTHLSEDTIMRWYELWKRGGIDALNPNTRIDKGTTQLPLNIQVALLALKKDNESRSINTLIDLIEGQGLVSKNALSRATVHRFLQKESASKRILGDANTIERRSFVAERAGDLWQGDVLHGPIIQTPKGLQKTFLVSLLDDASRLIVHSAFCFGETALDIEGVLKQALLKRGLPYKLLVDNGPAYRSLSLQGICARLDIRLIYCRPYEPEGKGKLERFHRTFREQFLNEIDMKKITSIDDLNARLWAWLEQIYHVRSHGGLEDEMTPIQRWREDLPHVRPLTVAHNIDEIFYHRYKRKVRKDGTVGWDGRFFEVNHQYVGEQVLLVVNPHIEVALRIESIQGENLGGVVLQDLNANLHRKRKRASTTTAESPKQGDNAVEAAYRSYAADYELASEESQ
jgi:putative transposase